MSPSVSPTDSRLRHFEDLEDLCTPYLIEHRWVDRVALTSLLKLSLFDRGVGFAIAIP